MDTPDCTVFGTIDEAGLATIDAIVNLGVVGTNDTGMPAKTVTITAVEIS